MPLSIKLIVYIIAGFAALGAGLYGIYEGTDLLKRSEVAEQPAPVNDEAPTTAGPAKTIAPTFDLVRVEPTGEIVAAGQSSGGARVELVLTDEVLAEATANAGGEWALVSDRTLAPGSYDLLVRATGPDGTGEMVEGDRVTVVIEGPDRTPLVAVTPPDQPTRVVQHPEASEQQVVAAGQTAAPETEAPATAPDTAVASGMDRAPDAAAPAAPEPAAGEQGAPTVVAATADGSDQTPPAPAAGSAPAAAAPATERGAPAPASAASGQSTVPATGERVAAAADDEPAANSEPGEVAEMRSGPQPQETAAGGQPVAAPAADPPPPSSPLVADSPSDSDVQVSIETVEVEEPATLMLGGRAREGASVRIYLNNERLADLKAGATGRWSGTLERAMPPGRYEVRADVIDEQGNVLGRAEVRFDRLQVALEEEQAAQETGEPASDGSGITIVARGDQAGQVAPAGQPGASGQSSVIMISRGDNLWRIARKIYGKGIRHTVIYEANKNQIRNPHLIYPGQVFTIPVLEEDDDRPKG
ncbi:LysM domain-containing protein [Tepidamorphus gemmatus]|uniref:LysM domain-containing protein n=1 Tax=Tepidamorphus gemmatus TaxID=747076 RepID=A0A4R3LXN5_9HYPH|nr:LysM peptidoglycan-binding domain-containing protein [Tepidamorphus gemmatus]TCT05410.1 LysM domain-containing protein [Tepidamorphus gemmatus]